MTAKRKPKKRKIRTQVESKRSREGFGPLTRRGRATGPVRRRK